MGKTIAIVGAQWGDEGKGKIVDFLTEKADIVARATGGNNAGHTVVVGDDTFKFNLIPSGIVHKGKLNVCGNGMAIYPPKMLEEITELERKGYLINGKNLVISSSAHTITEDHVELDKKTGGKVGTTGRGIGPCYMDKIGRTGVRMADFVLGQSDEAKRIKPLVRDTYLIMNQAIEAGKNVLIEGAQATMLDIDHGTYPYVTSSNPTAGGACTGLGIGPTKINEVVGIVKAYTTRVGRGPFPTELGTDEQTNNEGKFDELTNEDIEEANSGDEYYAGKVLRKRGVEYGTTTGRARRTGWFDAVIVKYARRINGLGAIALTKLDCFSDFRKIKLCTAYEIAGKKTEDLPLRELDNAKPIYEEMPGWNCGISDARNFDDLPKEAKDYVNRIEELAGVPICIVSVGPKRSQTFVLDEKFLF